MTIVGKGGGKKARLLVYGPTLGRFCIFCFDKFLDPPFEEFHVPVDEKSGKGMCGMNSEGVLLFLF